MKRFLAFCLLAVVLAAGLWGQPAVCAEAKTGSAADWTAVAQGIVRWKKLANGSSESGYLLNDTHLALVGSSAGDWYAFAISRFGAADNQSGYLAVLREYVQNSYRKSGGLSGTKVTEWHRIALTVLACGGDPERFGTDANGRPINLIADGTYDRGKTASLGAQGLNGWIWALLTLDSRNYEVPDGAYNSREDMIAAILSCQLADGGFPLAGSNADVDITAMALQALAPYYNSGTEYTFTLKETKRQVTRTVREAADEALSWLSEQQLADGAFASYGTANANTTSQVVVALCSLGIHPERDARFRKNGSTVMDALLGYRQTDGGFSYANNGGSNSMAGEQALYAITALLRLEQGKGRLYDLTDVKISASAPTPTPGKTPSPTAVPTASPGKRPTAVPTPTDASAPSAMPDPSAAASPEPSGGITPQPTSEPSGTGAPNGTISPTAGGAAAPDVTRPLPSDGSTELPEKLTTADYAAVVARLEQLKSMGGSAEGRAEEIERLERAKEELEALLAELEALNRELPEALYPLDELSWRDRKEIEAYWERYQALAQEDRQLVRCGEDLRKARAQVRASLRWLWLRAGVGAAVIAVAAALAVRARRRKTRREEEEG